MPQTTKPGQGGYIDFNLNFMAPFYGWGSTISRLESHYEQFTLYHSDSRNSRYSFDRHRKDERLSQPWSHHVVLKLGLLDWESSALKLSSIKSHVLLVS